VTARGVRERERYGAGVVARLFQRRCEAARVSCAQASSGSHPEGCGLGDSGSLRAASAWRFDSMEGCLGPWRRLSKPETCLRPWLRRSNALLVSRRAAVAGDADGPRAGAFRSDDGTQRSVGFGSGSPKSRAQSEARCERVGIHDAELHTCGAGVGDARCSLLHPAGRSRAGRRATAECAAKSHRLKWATVNRPAPRVPR